MKDNLKKLKRLAVTGGSGRLGSQVIEELLEHDYEVISLDVKARENPRCQTMVIDLNNYKKVLKALKGCDAVVHLAAHPDPYCQPSDRVFSNNVNSTYHILDAASKLGITKVVLASSESTYGFAWAIHPVSPLYFPIDEEHPQLPQEWYGLSKTVNELTAEMFHRRTGMQVVSLRLSTILTKGETEAFKAEVNEDPGKWKRILWSYVDVRDAAAACRLACEANGLGAVHLNITADKSCCNVKSADLIRMFYPEVSDIRMKYDGREALINNSKAKRILHWRPNF